MPGGGGEEATSLPQGVFRNNCRPRSGIVDVGHTNAMLTFPDVTAELPGLIICQPPGGIAAECAEKERVHATVWVV